MAHQSNDANEAVAMESGESHDAETGCIAECKSDNARLGAVTCDPEATNHQRSQLCAAVKQRPWWQENPDALLSASGAPGGGADAPRWHVGHGGYSGSDGLLV